MSTYDLVLLLLIALVLATLLVLFLPARRSRTPAGPPAERDLTGLGPGPWSREDDRYWLGGLIYYNPGDPEPFIPKRFGLGWTVNFGHPLGKVLLVVLIGMVLLPIVLALLDPGLPRTGCHTFGCHPTP
jgi:uncharacterized membrane protein